MSRNRLKFLLMTTAAGALVSQAAFAQDSSTAVGEVVITASRTERAGFSAPTPTTVIGAADLQQRGTTNIVDILNEMPSFRATNTPQQRTIFGGAGQSNADLRGLGNRRTLVMIDGRRHVGAPVVLTAGVALAVDLNLIPTTMIERSEVVTGGASAAWGSDAVAGVVNFITAKNLNGFKADVSYGQTKYNDAQEYRAGLAYGSELSGGKGHVTIGAEYVNQKKADLALYSRPWGDDYYATMAPTAAERAAGAPALLWASPVRTCNEPPGGVILATINAAGTATTAMNSATAATNPFRGVAFGQNGAIVPWDYGSQRGTSSLGGCRSNQEGASGYVSVPIERYSTLVNLEYNLTPDLKAFAQAGFADSKGTYVAPGRRDINASLVSDNDFIRINVDNAYLPASLRQTMVANNVSGFFLGRGGIDLGRPNATAENTMQRVVGGLEGKLGGTWKWDASVQIGKNLNSLRYNHLSLEKNFRNAYDAVFNAAGQIVCRINQTSVTDPACAPVNVMGFNGISAAADAYVHGNMFYDITTTQAVAAANINGEPFSTWAGPVSFAAGAEWRKEKINAVSDAAAEKGLYDYQNNRAYAGSNSVKELYAETIVPLAKDSAFAKALDLNAAVRFTDYELSGAVTTWKAGVSYEPVDQVRLRLTRSRDIRAPQLTELFGFSSSTTSATNPFTSVNTGPILGQTGGNTSLTPEIADTLTAGIVLSPDFWGLNGLRLSVDFYDIDIKDAIATYTSQQIVDRCATELRANNSTGFFCNLVTGSKVAGPGFVINGILNKPFNLTRQTAQGVDVEAAYSMNLGGGRLNLRVLASNNRDQTNYDVAGATQNAGYLASTPRWTGNSSVTYTRGPWSTTLQARYVGKVRRDTARIGPDQGGYAASLANSVNDNLNAALTYFNWSGYWNIRDSGNTRLQAYAVINNLLDRKPPAAGASFFYDQLGRAYKVGLRMNF